MSDDLFQPDTPQQLPGAFLRASREAQGMTVAEVAGVTKFSPRQIEALENDDFSQLQGATFQRGFVRAYARMLRLDPEPLLAMLETDAQPVQELVVPPENMGETNPRPFYRKHLKALAVLVVVIAGVLIAAFTMSPYFNGSNPAAQTATREADPSVPVFAPTTVDLGHVSAVAAEVVQPTVSQSATALALPVVEPEAASATQTTPVAPAPAVALPVLKVEFSDLSWLEVKDGNEQILITGEFARGEVKTVSKAKPPYQIWIGKSSAVKVTYQGQPVDIQPYTREDVARLTLGR